MSRFYRGWERYERTARIPVQDGIKTRTTKIASQWWARQWMDALDSFGWSNRLSRGRSYARSGQVLDYKVESGQATARVQGSRRRPYDVRISVAKLGDDTWERVLDAMSERAEFAARLLAGEMPHEIGDVFKAAGAALLPGKEKDLVTDCSCPDWANPCKHVAAVHYVLAEALDGDPFILFALRGRDREAVLDGLRTRRGGESEAEVEAPGEELEALQVEGFWRGQGDLSVLDVGLAPPRVRASLLRRLGAPGAWTSADEMVAVFGPLLKAASEEALRAAVEQ